MRDELIAELGDEGVVLGRTLALQRSDHEVGLQHAGIETPLLVRLRTDVGGLGGSGRGQSNEPHHKDQSERQPPPDESKH